MNFSQLIIDSVYEFEKYQATKKISKIEKFFSFFRNRFLYLYSLTRLGDYYIPSKKIYKLDKQLILNANKLIDSELYNLSKSCLFTAEIKKSCARANMRYGFECIELSAAILKEIYGDDQYPFKIKSFKWMNPLHPIIHLPNDIEERGNLHVDLHIEGGKTVTVWIPFTEYQYPGIVTVSKMHRILGQYLGHKIATFIFKRVKKTPLIMSSNPVEWLSWNDTFRHSGNLNQTNSIAIAFMVRFSNFFHSNNWISIKKLLKIKKSDNDHIFINENKLLLDDAQNIVMEFVNQIGSKNAKSPKDFLSNLKESPLIKNTLKNLNSKKKEIFLLHITKYVLSTTWVKIKTFKYIEWNSKDNLLLQELFEVSLNYLDLKISKYFFKNSTS